MTACLWHVRSNTHCLSYAHDAYLQDYTAISGDVVYRLSASDDIKAPIPGFLVGGPNPGQQDKAFYPTASPDESYVDTEDSYASNEVAINWNAALVALSSSLDALAVDSVK